MSIRTRPISNREYVDLSLSELQDVLDHYDRALTSRKRALADASEDDVYGIEKEIKQLKQLREAFISSRAADGEKFALID